MLLRVTTLRSKQNSWTKYSRDTTGSSGDFSQEQRRETVLKLRPVGLDRYNHEFRKTGYSLKCVLELIASTSHAKVPSESPPVRRGTRKKFDRFLEFCEHRRRECFGWSGGHAGLIFFLDLTLKRHFLRS